MPGQSPMAPLDRADRDDITTWGAVPARRPERPLPDPFHDVRHGLWLSAALFAVALCLGTAGYMAIEGWGLLDALYMTVITLATVGYGETRPLGPEGRIFTIGLIVVGFAAAGSFFNQVARAYSEGYFQEGLRRRRRHRILTRMQDHFIVCGYGRMGRQIGRDLRDEGAAVVVIEQDPARVALANEDGLVVLTGDAGSDHLLTEAGIGRARCVLCALPSDAENLFIVVSAKILNPRIRAIARSSSEEGTAKLIRVGTDQVVSPYVTGGKRMAAAALRPQVVDLVEAAMSGSTKVYIEEILLPAAAPLCGRTLGEARLTARSGALVLALRRAGGRFLGAPPESARIEPGDMLICLGTGDQLRHLSELLLPRPQG